MEFLRRNTINEVKAFIDTNPHACAIKDKNSVFIHANANYARLVGFKHAEDFLGRTDFDLRCGASQCAPLFQAQDQEVIRQPKVMKILDIQLESGEKWHTLLTTKTAFFNANGGVEGTFFQMQDITSEATLQFCFALGKSTPYAGESNFASQFSYIFGTVTKPELTERQGYILFFLIRRYTVKKIAFALELSPKIVRNELDILRKKFNTLSIGELIDKSITQGCINLIPRGLSSRQQSIILHSD